MQRNQKTFFQWEKPLNGMKKFLIYTWKEIQGH